MQPDLGVVPEPVTVESVQHPYQLDQLIGHRQQVSTGSDVPPAPGVGRQDRRLELANFPLELGQPGPTALPR